eukprot:TRINITY_DN32810_c0_g1_i2.p3 TRINITY_DN32810_c0_g1~~TRINITY_DN32810_c0_g1_i2.p3  ORF type:complete len:164 (-),score=14.06 TRINITY_DN32810_c0_g1_i2:192-683(-)
MPNTLAEVVGGYRKNGASSSTVRSVPLFFSTATNDGAFWPAPYTSVHERGCFDKAMKAITADAKSSAQAGFVQFSSAACPETGSRKPFPDGGHNCPLKTAQAGFPENPWVLTAAKLYAQQDGSAQSRCYAALWGNGAGSLQNSTAVEHMEIRKPQVAGGVLVI